MDTKEHIQEIYKVEADKYGKTRDIHWRLNIAVWTVIIVAIYAKGNGNLKTSELPLCLLLCIYFVFVIIHSIFVYKIHRSLFRSLNRMNNMAIYLIENDDPTTWNSLEEIKIPNDYYWEFIQVSITVFLILIFHFIQST